MVVRSTLPKASKVLKSSRTILYRPHHVQPTTTTHLRFLDFLLNTALKSWFMSWLPLIWITAMPFSLVSQKISLIGSRRYRTLTILQPFSSSFIGSLFHSISNARFSFSVIWQPHIFQTSFVLTPLPSAQLELLSSSLLSPKFFDTVQIAPQNPAMTKLRPFYLLCFMFILKWACCTTCIKTHLHHGALLSKT